MRLVGRVGRTIGFCGLPRTRSASELADDENRSSAPLRHMLLFFVLAAFTAFAQPGQPAPVQPSLTMQDSNLKPALPSELLGVGIDQKRDQQVPLDAIFRDESGRAVPLSSFFQTGKPVLLVPVYYRCPMLCTQILNGVASSLKAVSLNPGQDFEILSVSFDPKYTW